MKKNVTFKPDRREIRKLPFTRGTEKVVGDSADKVATAAKGFAPARTGAYRAGIRGKTVKTKNGYVGQVEATHYTSHWIEFGTIKQKARAPLRRGLEAVLGNQIGVEK